MKRRRAFTVTELLVVIVIVGLLAALIFPILSTFRDKSHRSPCMNNLQIIGWACAQYAPDNVNRIPWGKPSVFANVAVLSNYLGTTRSLVCPNSRKKRANDFGDPKATDTANVSYTQQAATTTGMIWLANANEILFWDQGVAGNPCGPTGDSGLSWAANSNHKGVGGNVLFNDGHVAFHTNTPGNMPLGCLNP